MSKFVIALVLAIGAGGFTYTKLGRRVGYANTGRVWMAVSAVSVVSLLILIILLYTLFPKL